ncbi:MAG: hypothetical protein AABW91_00535 [Nanoarchaeota archaeon]
MKNKEWVILIAVVIVIALVVSLMTVNLTGNVVKLNQDRFGKYNVYTTAEVNQLIGALELRVNGLYDSRLKKFNLVWTPIQSESTGSLNCNDMCILADVGYRVSCKFAFKYDGSSSSKSSYPISCDERRSINESRAGIVNACFCSE